MESMDRLRSGREELIERVAEVVREDGTVDLPGGLEFRRASSPRELGHGVSFPALCVIAQGSKEMLLGDDRYRYDPAHYLIATAAFPIAARITEASEERPTSASSSASTPPSSARSWSRPATSRRGATPP